MKTAIGTVSWGQGDDYTIATLFTDGVWSCVGRLTTAEYLGAMYHDYDGPADGTFGHALLYRLAETVGGTVTIFPAPTKGPVARVQE